METQQATHWVHDLSPYAIHFGDGIGIRWYGLAYLGGFLLAWWLLRLWSRRNQLPLDYKGITDAVFYIAISMMIGGRIGYCLFYYQTADVGAPWAIVQDPLSLFKVWEGGMASHGGVAGMFIGTWLFCRKRAVNFLVLGDTVAATAGIGIVFGRIANFINGELWGRASNVSWAIIFPMDLSKLPRHPSQLYAVGLEGLMMLAVVLPLHFYHLRPGLSIGAGIATYCVGRFIGEFWREPDPGYALYFGWMSKGQALTIPLFLVALSFFVYAWRRGPKPDLYLRPQAVPKTA
jgi:phosphatidylglycerol:prolipoprotein diacylglycerol transferase